MEYKFNLQLLWDDPYTRPIMSGYKYVTKKFSCKYPLNRLFSQDDWADVMSAAFEHGFAVWQATKDINRTFVAARKGTENELRYLLRPYLYKISLIERVERSLNEKLKKISLLKIARLLYAKLRKKGTRGQHSAIIKAFIIQQKMLGKSQARITRELETTRFKCSFDNVRRHYQSARALIFDIKGGNITR